MEAIGRLSRFSNSMFYTLDIAKMGDKWRVVEINDGQMSGLSCIDSESFYSKLSSLVK
jgi:glutathione synthase/RimK-type ligase-like ATP-grasp enzyme